MFNYERRLVKMAELKSIEKSYIEDFLEMQSGYVLDFSNNKFERFIYDSINIEIYEGEGYNEYCSKANKIRHILNKESNLQVAKLLEDLVEYKSYNNKKRAEISGEEISVFDKNLEQKVIDIINRITKNKEKKQVNQSTDLKGYDVFISHANKDKEDFVSKLYASLNKLGISIFYDTKTLEWGDNWKQKILEGTKKAEFAIIVISKNFFDREWTEKELYEFLNRQNENGQKTILPILHGINIKDLQEKYPDVADRQAIDSSEHSPDEIALLFANQLIKRLKEK